MKIKLENYDYFCSDGCCREWGVTCFIDGDEFGRFGDAEAALVAVLEQKFGVDVEIE